MSLSVGIVGLPNVGKSTIFNILTSNDAVAANYPFATIDPNVGIVEVADERLNKLSALYPESPLVPSTVTFTDIAGLVAGAHEGEGLGNQFLANIREVSAIAHIVRTFESENVSHVGGAPDPARDIETINTELILADIQTLSKRRDGLDKPARNDAGARRDLEVVDTLSTALDEGRLLTTFLEDKPLDVYLEEAQTSHELANVIRQLLTVKPMFLIFNVDEATLQDEEARDRLAGLATPHEHVLMCAQLETELTQLDEEDARQLLGEYGQTMPGRASIIQAGYRALGLISFFTAGEKEVRAWPIPRGYTAPQAAGTIHSDFERGFIAAEIIHWQQLVDAGSRVAARTNGLLRTEGKNYIMSDGEVAEFRFNL